MSADFKALGSYAGPEIVDSGLVLSLDAGNTKSYPGSGTTWTDLSGNGNTATLVNSPNFNFLNKGSFSFNGSNAYCTIPSASNLLTFGTTDFSISFWIYLNSTAVNHTILTNYNEYNSGFNTYFFIGYWSARSEINMLHAAGNYTAGATVTANTWSHICFTKTGTTFNVYLNGSLANTTTSASNDYSGTGRTILIGGGLADFGYLNGNLAGLHINRGTVLTAAQVAQNYNATVGRYSNLPFSPSDISGLQLWLDASEAKSLFSDTAGTTLATTDGTSIALWKDKSGNSRNLAQSTSGNRPVLKKAVVNSLDGIRFDGTNDYLDYATNIRPSAYSVFAVVNKTTTSSVTFCGASDTAGNGHARYFEISSGFYATNDIGIITGNGTDNYRGLYTQNSAGNLIVNNTPTVLSMTSSVTGSGTTLELFKNNSSPATTVIGANITSVAAVNRNFAVGRLGDYNGNYLQGDIYEILIYNSALTTTQRQQVESYLNTKWKVY